MTLLAFYTVGVLRVCITSFPLLLQLEMPLPGLLQSWALGVSTVAIPLSTGTVAHPEFAQLQASGHVQILRFDLARGRASPSMDAAWADLGSVKRSTIAGLLPFQDHTILYAIQNPATRSKGTFKLSDIARVEMLAQCSNRCETIRSPIHFEGEHNF